MGATPIRTRMGGCWTAIKTCTSDRPSHAETVEAALESDLPKNVSTDRRLLAIAGFIAGRPSTEDEGLHLIPDEEIRARCRACRTSFVLPCITPTSPAVDAKTAEMTNAPMGKARGARTTRPASSSAWQRVRHTMC